MRQRSVLAVFARSLGKLRASVLVPSLCALALVSSRVQAQSKAGGPEAHPVAYSAPLECPTAKSFAEQVKRSSPRTEVQLSLGGDRAAWTVSIERSAAGYTGRMTSLGLEREIVDRSCDALVSALAYVLAFSVDPEAMEKPIVPVRPTEREPQALPERPKSRLFLDVAARVDLRSQSDFGAVVGLGGFVDVGLDPVEESFAGKGPGLFYPAARFGFSRTLGQSLGVAVNGFPFANVFAQWTTGDLSLCPIRFGPKGFFLRPCARGAVGALQVEGRSVPGASSETRVYAEVGPTLQVEGRVGHLALGVDVGMNAVLTRDTFLFLPSTLVFEVPPFNVQGGFWAGARF